MKETVHFTKMQGAGNDYIYIHKEIGHKSHLTTENGYPTIRHS